MTAFPAEEFAQEEYQKNNYYGMYAYGGFLQENNIQQMHQHPDYRVPRGDPYKAHHKSVTLLEYQLEKE